MKKITIAAAAAALSLTLTGVALWLSCPKSTPPDTSDEAGYYEQWFEEHKNEQGIIPLDVHERWYAHDLKLFAAQERNNFNPFESITQLSPNTQQGGRTRAILIDRNNPDLMWAGCVSGGLWRSENAGTSWRPINDAASNLAVSCITQNPFRPNEIYYGTGEVRGSSVPAGNGIHKSTDYGLTFTRLVSTATSAMRFANFLAHSPVRDSVVYLGASEGFFVSTDAGNNWRRTLTGNISGILCHPDGRVLVTVQGVGLFVSTNLGQTLSRVSQPDFPTTTIGRILLANCRTKPDSTYMLFATSLYQGMDGNAGLFRSGDFGRTWTKMGDSSSLNGRIGTTQAVYNQMLGVHHTQANWVVIGAVNARKSINGGLTFQVINTGHSDNHEAISLNNSDNVIFGNDGGVYRMPWTGTASTPLNGGYLTHQYYAGNFAPRGTLAAGGTQDNGSWRHNGINATRIFGSDGGFTHISQQDSTLAYVSTQNGPVHRLQNFAATVSSTRVTPTVAVDEGVSFINEFQINYADGQQLFYRTNQGLWRTNNRGASWQRLNIQNIPNIQAVGVTPNPNPSVYIGGANTFYRVDTAGLRVSRDSFVDLRNTVPGNVRSLAWGNISFHPNEPTTIFVGMSSMSINPRAWKVRNAHTRNPTWINITGNLASELPIYYIQAHPDDPERILFAATAFGLYYTLDGGATWTKETRMPNVSILEMRLRATDRTLFLFTHGRGVWQIKLTPAPTTSTKSLKAIEPVALKFFPNPATEWLRIELADKALQLRGVQIFDMQGREVLSEYTQPTQINVAALPKGQYALRVYTNDGRLTTKVFLKSDLR